MRDELLALLEDGPHEAAQLSEWLGVRRMEVARELRAMAHGGLTKRVGVDKRWALASYVTRPGRPRRHTAAPTTPPPLIVPADGPARQASVDDDDPTEDVPIEDLVEPDADGEADLDELSTPIQGPPPRAVKARPALRQAAPVTQTRRSSDGGRSWWVGLSREQLREEMSARQQHMHDSRIARWVDGSVRD